MKQSVGLTKKQKFLLVLVALILWPVLQPEIRGDLIEYYKKAHRNVITSWNGASVELIDRAIELAEFRIASKYEKNKEIAEIVLQDLKILKREAENRPVFNSDSVADDNYYNTIVDPLVSLASRTDSFEELGKWKEKFNARNTKHTNTLIK